MGRPAIPIEIKLQNYKEDPVSGCWIWQGSLRGPYGQIHSKGKNYSAHRLAYEIWVGPILPGNYVRHKCDNYLCINPTHLDQGTQKENCNDAVSRGRAGRYGKGDGIVHSVCGTPYRIAPCGAKWCSPCQARRYAEKQKRLKNQ